MRIPSRLAVSAAGIAVATLVAATLPAQVPEPSTYVDVPAPRLVDWSDVNALTVDPNSPDGRTYIYPDEAAKNADISGDGTGSVAFIHWELDDASGRAPGIKAVTDDFAVPTHNCIMASGERYFDEVIVPKTCSDPRGSSKRIFLEIRQAGTPIDIVFTTGAKDIRYKGVKDPAVVGNDDDLSQFRDTYGIGRIYRVIQKFINDTDQRLVAIRVEVGTGVGDGFVALPFNEFGVAFELRQFVDREFFVGSTGAGDREVWDPMRFAHFSPKMFDTGERPRFEPGFFDDHAAGLFPPQAFQTSVAGGTKSQFIDSGTSLNTAGHFGAITPNYFDLTANQGAGAGILGPMFGYMMPDSIVPTVIERHDDGDPGTESDGVEAWWDGYTWRYGVAHGFAEVPADQLVQWAARPLGLNLPNVSDATRYGTAGSDDISGLNMDTYLYLGDALLEAGTTPYFNDGPPKVDSITVRYTAIPVSQLGAVPGTADPVWTTPGHEAPPLSSYMAATGVPVAINDIATTERGEAVNVPVLANDLLDGQLIANGPTVQLNVTNPANGTAVVEADNSVTYMPELGFTGQDSFTYVVTVENEGSNEATVKLTVLAPPDPDAPIAHNDSATTTGTEPVEIDVLSNDTVGPLEDPVDPEEATITLGPQPAFGYVVLSADKTVIYQAGASPAQPVVDYFTYTVAVEGAESNSALVIVRVDPTSVATIVPVAADDTATTIGGEPVIIDVLANDTLDGIQIPERGTVRLVGAPASGAAGVNADQTVTYAANAGFAGQDAFTYTVEVDGELSNVAQVRVVVEAPTPPPSNPVVESSGGGCATGPASGFEPLVPGAMMLLLGFYGVRRRRETTTR